MDFLDRTLENFREYLKDNTESKNTVKNYVSDLRIFLIFLDSRHAPLTSENFPLFLNSQTLSEFSSYLSVINPPATLNRRVSSVKKFFDYYMEHHPLPAQPSPPIVTFSTPLPASDPVSVVPEIPKPTPQESVSEAPDTLPVPEIVTPQLNPTPVVNEILPEQNETPPDSNGNLLRLLPQEITDDTNDDAGAHRNTPTPSNFVEKFKVQIICTISFLVGFFSTLALYPILYP